MGQNPFCYKKYIERRKIMDNEERKEVEQEMVEGYYTCETRAENCENDCFIFGAIYTEGH